MKMTMRMLPQIAAALLLLCASSTVQAANYRVQSTVYAVTVGSSLDLKNENCQNSFGKGSTLLDMSQVKEDFEEEEFEEAMTGVFFKEPRAAFFVALEGTDAPPDVPSGSGHYAIKTTPTKNKDEKTYDSYGTARVISHGKQAQLLCAVPVKEYKAPQPYQSQEEPSGETSSHKFPFNRLLLLLGLVGVAVLVRKRFMDPSSNTAAPRSYYSVLDQTAGGNNPYEGPLPAQGDLAESLTEGCELSYNPPATQGLV